MGVIETDTFGGLGGFVENIVVIDGGDGCIIDCERGKYHSGIASGYVKFCWIKNGDAVGTTKIQRHIPLPVFKDTAHLIRGK